MSLTRPKNVRLVNRRCCANCVYRIVDEDSEMSCQRQPDNNPWSEVSDPETGIHYAVCNGYKSATKNQQRNRK